MLEIRHFCGVVVMLVATGCATEPPAPAPIEVKRVELPAGPSPEALAAAAAEEAKAFLAQAETDIQRARAKRALWQSAWEDLLAARAAVASQDHAKAAHHARRASDFARLGLEQLTYPAVR
jgi:hypothetical protein